MATIKRVDGLISRAAAIEAIEALMQRYRQIGAECDRDGALFAQERIKKLPTVDAIPVEWFTEMKKACGMQGQIGAVAAMNWVLGEWKATKDEWQKEQEARA